MNQLKYERIDKGQKRGKRGAVRQYDQKGRYLPVHAPEVKSAAIADALSSLEHGETTDSIAARHNIPPQTLRAWLIGDPKADEARRVMFAHEISNSVQALQDATEPLALARAREVNRAWSWLAERRLPSQYGQSIHTAPGPAIQINIGIQRESDAPLVHTPSHTPT